MVTVQIGNSEERNVRDVDPSWINQQINRRRAAGEPVCARVSVHVDGINMILGTPVKGGLDLTHLGGGI